MSLKFSNSKILCGQITRETTNQYQVLSELERIILQEKSWQLKINSLPSPKKQLKIAKDSEGKKKICCGQLLFLACYSCAYIYPEASLLKICIKHSDLVHHVYLLRSN